MRYEERSDDELLELAQAGWRPAFAVLVHRYAPALLTAFADTPDPAERTFDVLLRAMKHLPEHDLSEHPGPWFFALAGRPAPARVQAPVEATIDRLWRDLDAQWPDGHVAVRRRAPVLRPLATVLGAIAVGVAVPVIALGLPDGSGEAATETVRAEPLEVVPTDEPEPEQLPAFEFPDVGEPGPATEPAAPIAPAPTEPPTPVAPVAPPPPPTDPGGPGDGGTDGPADPTDPGGDPTDPGGDPGTDPVDPPPSDDGGAGDGGGEDDGGLLGSVGGGSG